MIRNKEEFVKALWEDYRNLPEDKREDSFIYTYFQRKKDQRAQVLARSRQELEAYIAQKKRDKYIMLRSAYLAYKDEVISAEACLDIFQELTGTTAISKKYEKLSLKEQIEVICKKMERKFLMGCVSDFFQNAGYRVNKHQDVEEHIKLPDKHRKEKDGYTDDLAMLFAFYQYQGMQEVQKGDVGAYINRLDAEHIEKCKQLHHILQKDDRCEIFVPLYVDMETGAGVYIIGKNKYQQYTKRNRPHKKSESLNSCYACVIYFSAIFEEISEYEELNLTMMVESFDTVEEAFDRFQAGLSTQEFYENYPMENEDILPVGADRRFELYFVEKRISVAKQKEELIRQRIKEEQAQKERARYEHALLLERKKQEK